MNTRAERTPKVTDDEIEQALIQAHGQPTKAAEILGVDYTTIWRRCRDNPRLEEVKQAYRGASFQKIDGFTVASVLAGVMNQPVTDENGEVVKDEDGKIMYKQIAIAPNLRLQHGNLLMNLYKGSEGIKDQVEISSDNSIDLTKLDLETLKKLEKAGTKDKE